LSVSAAALLVVGAGILGLWTASTNAIRENYQHYLTGLAGAAATLVDPELHRSLRRPEQQNGPDYVRAVSPLRRFRDAVPDVHYIYTLVRDGKDVRFVLDAADPGAANKEGLPDQAGLWQPYHDTGEAVLRALGDALHDGVVTATGQPTGDSWGTFMTGLAPIHDAAGRQIGAVGLDIDAKLYLARLRSARNLALAGLAPAGLLIGVLALAFYRVRLRGIADAHAAISAADAAKEAANALADERRWLSAVIEGTNVGTWEWEAGAGRPTMNERCAAMIGVDPRELRAMRALSWQSLIHPHDLLRLLRVLAGSLKTPELAFVSEVRALHGDGRWVWILVRGKVMARDSRGRPSHVAGIVLDISARKSLELALTEAAQRDALTGLANRATFMGSLERAVARVRSGQQARFGLFFLDFDRFKVVNDMLGHNAGDELLRQIAGRLRAALRQVATSAHPSQENLVGRFGGDEFLIIVHDLESAAAAVAVAERLLNSLAPVYTILGSEVQSTASVGIVMSDQSSGGGEELVRNADLAMYEAKRAGRACSVVFDEAMHTRLTRHVTVETSLRRAIGTDQLQLVYQPIVDLTTGRSVSAEALVRWNHPSLGAISPNEFIPIAEESGLIVAVGQWVLAEACRAMMQWRRLDPQRAPETVSVNLSRAEIALGRGLLDRITTELERSGLPASRLQLEVTEREVMRDPKAARELLHELRRLGVKLAMDDFGTGTSSLSVLREYPFDTIKIDRAFLEDLSNNRDVLAVIHATINLVENLGMASLAEGVEQAAQVAVLQSLGCRYAQGYFFARPVAADRLLEAMIARPAVRQAVPSV
jgi:diguanylate cyclase (GGDEF)-like protein/PAS domain S-box-containing protein